MYGQKVHSRMWMQTWEGPRHLPAPRLSHQVGLGGWMASWLLWVPCSGQSIYWQPVRSNLTGARGHRQVPVTVPLLPWAHEVAGHTHRTSGYLLGYSYYFKLPPVMITSIP